ncbi:MAG: hypothetical protein HYT72_05800 [Candidatus Aenigmarchaeota archaeon]|nr:hypothetical protein [Candidatus Aenigmarchaeota archaeon]
MSRKKGLRKRNHRNNYYNIFIKGKRYQGKEKTEGFVLSKGINVLLSGVLLVAIVALLAVVILNWVTTLTKKEQATITNKTISCTGADVSIHSIFVDVGSNTSRISVRNSGFSDDAIVSATILNKQGDPAPNLTAFPINFPDGSIATISFNISGKMTSCSNFSRAIVSTQCTSDDQDKPLTCA